MKRSEKTLKEQFLFSRKYILGIFVVGLLRLVLVRSEIMPQLAYNPISSLAVMITFLAGWNAIKAGFGLKQVAAIGGLCFIGTIWLVPFLVSRYLAGIGMPSEGYLISLVIMSAISSAVNLLGYIIVALAGGWVSLKMQSRPQSLY